MQLVSICGLCRSSDKCFEKYHDEEDEELEYMEHKMEYEQHDEIGEIEMPERSFKYEVRQRNHMVE